MLKVAERGKGAMLLQRPIQLLEVPCPHQKVRLEDGNRALDRVISSVNDDPVE